MAARARGYLRAPPPSPAPCTPPSPPARPAPVARQLRGLTGKRCTELGEEGVRSARAQVVEGDAGP